MPEVRKALQMAMPMRYDMVLEMMWKKFSRNLMIS